MPQAYRNHVVTSWFSQGLIWGVSKVMRHHTENKLAVFDEWSHMSMGLRYRAGAMGIPFMPSRTMLGSDVGKRLGDGFKTMICPFTGEKLALLPALNPDVALIHVQRCDALRQCTARRTAVHGSRHRHGGQARHSDDRAHRLQRADPPHARPDAHSILHGGGGCGSPDRAAPRTSVMACTSRSSRTSTTMLPLTTKEPVKGSQDYLERYYYEPKSWSDYLSRLGLDAVLDACRRGRSVHND